MRRSWCHCSEPSTLAGDLQTEAVEVDVRALVGLAGPAALQAEAGAPLVTRSRGGAELTAAGAGADGAMIRRQAFAGMLWCKQLFYYDVARWRDGDPGQPPPPDQRLTGRNARWRSFDAFDIMSMPDKWEYPWFAAWDLAFQAVTLDLVDPDRAKDQLLALLDDRLLHPSGQLPAYEWEFSDTNPPLQAWAALRIYRREPAVSGRADRAFLERMLHGLALNFGWWVNRRDRSGRNLFEGGFLGLDNISVLDRSAVEAQGLIYWSL